MSDDTGEIERGAAPALRRANPMWKWLGAAALLLGGGALGGYMILQEIEPEPEAEVKAERPRLRMDAPPLAITAPPRPAPVVPPPVPVPAPLPVPEPPDLVPAAPEPPLLALPPPEPRYAEPLAALPPPMPAAEPGKPPEDPIEARRLESGLSGTGGDGGGGSAGDDREAERRGRGGLDLATTQAATATARRIEDMTFFIPKGTYLPCILNTAIQSDQSGMLTCTLPTDVHGADGTVVLFDRGSQLLGEYRSASLQAGIRRVYVVWDRVRTPTGVIVDIGSPGTGPLGQAGIGGAIDNHYWQRVGIPILMSAISFSAESYAREELSSESGNFVEDTTDDTLQGVLGEFARIRPTLHAHQGSTVGILVARDLDLSAVYRLARVGAR